MSQTRLLSAADSVLGLIDMQTSLDPVLMRRERTVQIQRRLIGVARALEVPILLTEHYSKGLGSTIAPLQEALAGSYQPIEKITFSAMGEPSFVSKLQATGRKTLVLAGCETHICVCQTALEAAAHGYEVHVVPDATTARHDDGHRFGLERMQDAGVTRDTWEMTAYQWLRKAGTPEFKACLPFFKEEATGS